MEGNKDEALKCARMGSQLLQMGQLEKAVRFFQKALRSTCLPCSVVLSRFQKVVVCARRVGCARRRQMALRRFCRDVCRVVWAAVTWCSEPQHARRRGQSSESRGRNLRE